jgi:hypothetical protein
MFGRLIIAESFILKGAFKVPNKIRFSSISLLLGYGGPYQRTKTILFLF